MGLQNYFEEFNKNIKLDYTEMSELAEKRDIILKKLRDDDDLPSFDEFNQGSYAMYTGVEPLDKDYDIDVGLRFNVNKDDYQPVVLKEKVFNILKDHTDFGAEIKQPCVTVKYKKNGDLAFHVDLAIYAYQDKDDKESQMYLARGKKSSSDEKKYWEKSDPIEMKDKIMDKWEDTKQRDQYRRVIRYLKRWKNLKFSSSGNSEPPGIGITLLAYEKFQPRKYDWLEEKYKFDDLEALIYLVGKIKDMFVLTGYSQERQELLYKIECNIPVEPGTNVFCKMSEIAMTEFRNKVVKLLKDLEAIKKEPDVIEQCVKLNKIFGDDFPVPKKEEESKKQRNFVPSSSEAGQGL